AISERRAEAFLDEISRLKRTGAAPEAGSELQAALDAYRTWLRDRRALDFDDLIALPVTLLQSEPAIRADYQSRFPYLSVDEYQDLDEQQYRLFRALVPDGGNACVIGDPDQAIYGFRGADVRFFLRFQQDFPTARQARLTRNYRSRRVILDGSLQV